MQTILFLLINTFILSAAHLVSFEEFYDRLIDFPVQKRDEPEYICKDSPVDVVLVIDSSRSINELDFKEQIEFLVEFVTLFDIRPSKVRFAAVSFGQKVITQGAFNFNKYNTTEEVQWGLRRIKYEGVKLGGETNTAFALKYTRERYFVKARPEAKKLCIVLTDGRSTDPRKTQEEASLIRSENVTMVAIGIGKRTSLEELKGIASNSDLVFTVDKHSLLETIQKKLILKTCADVEFITQEPPLQKDEDVKTMTTIASTGKPEVTTKKITPVTTKKITPKKEEATTKKPTPGNNEATTKKPLPPKDEATTKKPLPPKDEAITKKPPKDNERTTKKPSSGKNDATTKKPTPGNNEDKNKVKGCNGPLDINFVFNPVQIGTQRLMSFVENTVTSKALANDDVRVGIITVPAPDIIGFRLNRYKNKRQMKKHFDVFKTNLMAPELKDLRLQAFLAGNGGRANARKIGVVFLRGELDDVIPSIVEATLAKASGIEMYVISLGPTDDRVIIEHIATDSEHVIQTSTTIDFLQLSEEFMKFICKH